MTQEALFRHLWTSYESTINKRQKNGDVELLAEAAERMEWPGAPEMGKTIASLLRSQIIKNKTGQASQHHKVVRDREILTLARIHAEDRMAQTDSYETIAEIYNMTVDAVSKQVRRKDLDK